ncbi:hypothetical protein [Pseudofrankia asymbiotica]|uniref:hypothetical protein n=1 Tax=Pseudofrankia asymbiotica TaxID=1834516 RepID=UPI0013042F90|nr:hypothetical protein [Pseudofrankia asymbiotica]
MDEVDSRLGLAHVQELIDRQPIRDRLCRYRRGVGIARDRTDIPYLRPLVLEG